MTAAAAAAAAASEFFDWLITLHVNKKFVNQTRQNNISFLEIFHRVHTIVTFEENKERIASRDPCVAGVSPER